MTPESVMSISTVIFMGLGLILKNKTQLTNKLIPIAFLALAVLKNGIATLGWVDPALAPLVEVTRAIMSDLPSWLLVPAGLSGLAFGWGGLFSGIVSVVAPSLIEAILPVGLHSFAKNTMQFIGDRELKKARKPASRPSVARKAPRKRR